MPSPRCRSRFIPPMLTALVCVTSVVHAEGTPRPVPPERLDRYWTLANSSLEAEAPMSGRNLTVPGCVTVTYTIGGDGRTRDFAVVRVAPPSDLGPMAVSLVRDMHYAPGPGNSMQDAVRTYLIVPFNVPKRANGQVDPVRQQAIMAPCRLPGFGAATR
ncbi:MAG: energy transducer TonB [Xanthomonadaceae bacterium]|nr:energy transducer TonB [Xanthomonadaceae bacterium]MDE2246586.1 energy transducer TonB [Xanthomonadaceae bacterium]